MERLFESKVSILQYTSTTMNGSQIPTAVKAASGYAEAVTVLSKSIPNRITEQDVYSFNADENSGVYIDTFGTDVDDIDGLTLSANATAFAMQITSELPSYHGSHIGLRISTQGIVDNWSFLLLSSRQDYVDEYNIGDFVKGYDANSVAYHARVL